MLRPVVVQRGCGDWRRVKRGGSVWMDDQLRALCLLFAATTVVHAAGSPPAACCRQSYGCSTGLTVVPSQSSSHSLQAAPPIHVFSALCPLPQLSHPLFSLFHKLLLNCSSPTQADVATLVSNRLGLLLGDEEFSDGQIAAAGARLREVRGR